MNFEDRKCRLLDVTICAKSHKLCKLCPFLTHIVQVMGLYIGSMEGEVAMVRSLIPIRRTTKEKDRVEIDPNDLVSASEKAENVGLRVIGWYHSHPHITVHPSHIDLATQYSYQSMDPNFFGLIFSVFNYDNKVGQDTREVIAFRTVLMDTGHTCQYLQVHTSMPEGEGGASKLDVASAVSSISMILMNEENEEYSRYSGDGEVDDISNGATHLARLAHQAEMVGSAGLEAMEVLLAMQKEKIKVLQTRKAKLKQQLLLIEED